VNEMSVLDRTGDTKHIWDPNNEKEVKAMKRLFKDLTSQGYIAFKVDGKDGTKGEKMHKFDPEAGRMILIPMMVGG